MLKYLLNLISLIIFLSLCFLFHEISSAEISNAQNNIFRVKSHLVFDKKFNGKAYVLDGDSIKVGNKEVRLFGIDAPEYKQKCLDKNNIKYGCGIISREFLIKLVGGKNVECIYAEKDKYNRFLGKCFIDKISINQEIIKNGMAVIYNFTESDDLMDNLEKQAKQNKLGIWQGSFQLPKEYRKNNSKSKS